MPPLAAAGPPVEGGVVDWTVGPDGGACVVLEADGAGASGGGTLMFPGLVVPGAVPGCVGVTPPLAAAALPAPAVPGPPVVVWAKAQLACARNSPDATAMLMMTFMLHPFWFT